MRLIVLFLYFGLAAVCSVDLHQMLRHFETLDSFSLQVVTRSKRNTNGIILRSKHISFQTLGRKFNMVLFPGSSAIGPNFRARAVDGDGKTETVFVDPNNFYTGFLEDDRAVEIDAHFEDGILASSIYFPNETYVVEPAWRYHLTSTNATMITYRRSDVNWDEIFPIDPKTGNRTRMKDGIKFSQAYPMRSEGSNDTVATQLNGKPRNKRAVVRNRCPLIAVADYQFFRDWGRRRMSITIAFIISTIQTVNRYLQRTVWDNKRKYVKMGIHIEEMLIHTWFTKYPPDHYNADVDWDYYERLLAFSKLKQLKQVCLGHLFTSYSYTSNVLGLAFTAQPSAFIAGGICSVATVDRRTRYLDSEDVVPKTSMSTVKNSVGNNVLSMQYQLVVTHEIGHNWGANHDPYTEECAPSSSNNGKYIMWAISVSGYEKNNGYFSPCSKRSILAVLKTKSFLCFEEEPAHESLCGNGMIEMNEECDPGILEEGVEDVCCTNDCQLRKNTTCSDNNHVCCTGCKVANTSVRCADHNELTCKKESFCDGCSFECPHPGHLPDGTSCIDKGVCSNGECLDMCVTRGRREGKIMIPCLCAQNVSVMCRRCCLEVTGNGNGECLPTSELLDAGRQCYLGTCDETGHCVRVEQQLALRIYSFVTHLTVSELGLFMRSNITGTIILLSLMFWIPGCLIISIIDDQQMDEFEMDLITMMRDFALHQQPQPNEDPVRTANQGLTPANRQDPGRTPPLPDSQDSAKPSKATATPEPAQRTRTPHFPKCPLGSVGAEGVTPTGLSVHPQVFVLHQQPQPNEDPLRTTN